MTEPTAKSPAKRRVLTCSLVSLLGVGILAVAFVLAVAGFLRSKGVGVPDEEAVALEAKYGEAAEALVEQVEAQVKRVRETGAAARAALPDDAIISADWDVQVELRKVCTEDEEDVLRTLSTHIAWLERDDHEGMYELRKRLRTIRSGRSLTDLEKRFDPGSRPGKEVLESFGGFLLELPIVAEMEEAIDYGVWPMTPDGARHDGRLTTAICLLRGRTVVSAERGDTLRALASCVRMCRLHADIFGDPSTAIGHALIPFYTAFEALKAIGRRPEDERELLTAIAECLAVVPDTDAYAASLRIQAFVAGTSEHDWHRIPGILRGDDKTRLYRSLDQADALANLILNPAAENEARYQDILARFDRGLAYESGRSEPNAQDVVDVFTGEFIADFDSLADTSFLATRYGWLTDIVARKSVLETVLALGQHEAATGTYPDSLDALVPDRLVVIPVDPLSGKPLIYELAGDGYRLLRPAAREATEPTVLWEMGR